MYLIFWNCTIESEIRIDGLHFTKKEEEIPKNQSGSLPEDMPIQSFCSPELRKTKLLEDIMKNGDFMGLYMKTTVWCISRVQNFQNTSHTCVSCNIIIRSYSTFICEVGGDQEVMAVSNCPSVCPLLCLSQQHLMGSMVSYN